jgi:hypothetical protein
MGMAEQNMTPAPERWWGAARPLLQKHIGIVRAAEFALVAGFAAGAWFAGSEMFLALPALFLAWVVAVIGLMASSLASRWIIIWSVVLLLLFGGEGGTLYWQLAFSWSESSRRGNYSRSFAFAISQQKWRIPTAALHASII